MDQVKTPYPFDEFFASGREESISPFLTTASRKWGKNLSLKSALFSALLLLSAFILSFYHPSGSALLLCGVYLLVGTPALINALEDIRNLEINIDVLMTLAALLSVAIGSEMEGALLLVLFGLSAAMEQAVEQKATGTLIHLNQIIPRMACVIDEKGTVFERSVKEVQLGTLLLVRTGELAPLDGIVVEGSSLVDLSHLTGESQPLSKHVGDELAAGARLIDGTLTMRVTRTSSDSTLARIIKLITQAQAAKPKLENFLNKFGKYYATAIILLSLAFACLLPLLFELPYLGKEGSIYRALTFLIAASPCALIIAIPTAYLSAISSCARRGILLKGGVVLDALASCNAIAFDKTGTLTTGKLSCSEIVPLSNLNTVSIQSAIAIAAGLERHATHPMAHAVLNLAAQKEIAPLDALHFKSSAGFGLEAQFDLNGKKRSAFIGNPDFIAPKISLEKWQEIKNSIEKEEHLNTLLLVEEELFLFRFIDIIRPACFDTLKRLKEKEELHLVMLTGDHSEHARLVAGQLHIDEIHANLRPEQKLEKVDLLSQKGGLIMVGDGINDAPALARATVGISLGKIGSATAIDASDIVFLHDELSLLDWLKQKAHQTTKIVRQNLFLALGVILFATTPALLGWVPLWAAVILHEGGTVLVGLNSLRLLR